MKSDIIVIDSQGNGYDLAQKEAKKVAIYTELNHKSGLQLQLMLYMQATGDAKGAAELAEKFATVPATIKADIVNLELEKIPVDIRVTYEK